MIIEIIREFQGNTLCGVALGLWLGYENRPISKGFTSKTEAQL